MTRFILVVFLLATTLAATTRAQEPAPARMICTFSAAQGIGVEEGVMRRDPSDVIQVGDLYYVWYTKGKLAHGYDATVWYATSLDGHKWVERGEAIARGTDGSWDSQSVFTPNIMVADQSYYLYYTAVAKPFYNSGPNISKTAIGIAVSNSPDGPWKKVPTNPILKASDNPDEFDSMRVDDACLLIRDGKYWLYYKGRQWNNTPANTKMGVAVADAPTGPYRKSRLNPLVKGGHEVLVWPYGNGVVALIGPTGPPEIRNTLRHAPDGLKFSKLATLVHSPSAPGALRPHAFADDARGAMIGWGICIGHKKGHLPFLQRFQCELQGAIAKPRDDPDSPPLDQLWVVYEGSKGPGKGKHVVLVSGDEEYRSEEGLPQLGKILARHHGFKCTVLFAVDPTTGLIDPDNRTNIPGLEALKTADLMIIATRFRDLPDEQMQHVAQYVDAGKPVIGIRAAVVAFDLSSKTYERFGFKSRTWKGGFGQQVLGQTWISHHGRHGRESTRGVVLSQANDDPIIRGCDDIWGPTDVYTVRLPQPKGTKPLLLGQVLEGMKPTDRPVAGEKNDPMMPIAWTRTYRGTDGQIGRVFMTTMGAATDLESEGLRRLLVNATYWCIGIENLIPARANVEPVGRYAPLPFGFGGYRKGMRPRDFRMEIKD